MEESTTPNGERRPARAEDFRKAKVWYFDAGLGLPIQCRHLDYHDLLFSGEIPLPVLERFSTFDGITLKAVMAGPDQYKELLQAAMTYASLAALSPRVSLTKSDDPDVLFVSDDPETSDLPPGVLVRLMNEGTARRLQAVVSRAALFRRPESESGVDPRSTGASVRDSAEPTAAAALEPSH